MNGIDGIGLTNVEPVKTMDNNQQRQAPSQHSASAVAAPVAETAAGTVTAIEQVGEDQGAGLNQGQLNKDQLEQVAQELNKMVGGSQRGLKFHVDDDSGRDVVTVTDIATEEVIRQIPSEEVLELASKLSDLTGGLLETEA